MSRTGITFDDVKKTIAELQGRQKNPTVDSIREILGTGSKSTIARFLREWKSQQGLCSNDANRLPSDLLGIVNGLWDALRNKVDIQADQYRQECNANVAQIQQKLTQAIQLGSSLRANVHLLEEQLHQQKQEAQQMTAKLTTEEHEKLKMTERAATFESRCRAHQAENQRLHQLLKHMQENLEHYQAATQQMRQEQSLLMEKKQNEYEQRLSALLTQANIVSNEKSVCQAQYDQLTQVHELLTAEHKILTTQYTEIQGQHAFLKITHDKIQYDHDVLKEKNQIQATELATLQHTMMELQLNIKSRDEKISSLEDTIARESNKIEVLRHETQIALQEKAALEGQLKQMQAMLSSNKMRVVS